MRADNTKRLAEVEHELQTLGSSIEPRKVARRILDLLYERDRLRGVWLCLQCGGPFVAIRDHARYCSPACRQSAYRDRALRMRVTDSGSVRPVCGVPTSNGQSGGSTATAATRGEGAAT